MFDTFSNKAARGYILRLAQISYPHPIGSNVLDPCLIDAGMVMTPTQIEGHLQYLEQKEYLTTTKSQLDITGTPIILATLTPKGIDLLEKTITDPGVTVR